MKKTRKYDDIIYNSYIGHNPCVHELKKGLCYKKQGKHFIRCNFEDLPEHLTFFENMSL